MLVNRLAHSRTGDKAEKLRSQMNEAKTETESWINKEQFSPIQPTFQPIVPQYMSISVGRYWCAIQPKESAIENGLLFKVLGTVPRDTMVAKVVIVGRRLFAPEFSRPSATKCQNRRWNGKCVTGRQLR